MVGSVYAPHECHERRNSSPKGRSTCTHHMHCAHSSPANSQSNFSTTKVVRPQMFTRCCLHRCGQVMSPTAHSEPKSCCVQVLSCCLQSMAMKTWSADKASPHHQACADLLCTRTNLVNPVCPAWETICWKMMEAVKHALMGINKYNDLHYF
jgi:hypothetical protein